ncbi:MAG: hypothetical protein LBN27_11145 [Prevotellaceae bacterium]|jgi:hypothetical protein|nr:hypothetical protein [Prevotellaceae bacterium]
MKITKTVIIIGVIVIVLAVAGYFGFKKGGTTTAVKNAVGGTDVASELDKLASQLDLPITSKSTEEMSPLEKLKYEEELAEAQMLQAEKNAAKLDYLAVFGKSPAANLTTEMMKSAIENEKKRQAIINSIIGTGMDNDLSDNDLSTVALANDYLILMQNKKKEVDAAKAEAVRLQSLKSAWESRKAFIDATAAWLNAGSTGIYRMRDIGFDLIQKKGLVRLGSGYSQADVDRLNQLESTATLRDLVELIKVPLSGGNHIGQDLAWQQTNSVWTKQAFPKIHEFAALAISSGKTLENIDAYGNLN